jgi:D-sedoheptulose 7-phosphate isomerase
MSSAAAPSSSAQLVRRIAERERVVGAFFGTEGTRLAQACHAIARSFARGGTLIAWGAGSAATDASHVTVEFMHPVIVGKRALPALDLTSDPTGSLTLGDVARPGDVAIGIAHGPPGDALGLFLAEADARRLETVCLAGAGQAPAVDHAFSVPSDDPEIVQEVQETAYHVLWELVHVFFEHPGLLDDDCVTCGDVAVPGRVVSVAGGTAVIEHDGAREDVAVDLLGDVRPGEVLVCHAGVALERLTGPDERDDPTGFLYPFLDRRPEPLAAVLADVEESIGAKAREVVSLRRTIDVARLLRCAKEVRARLEQGGRLITFGNGGSSTDAQDAAADCLARGWPALALTNDVATCTAIANDVGFDKVFARQLIALGRPADVALAVSTSGASPNVMEGLEEAHRRGMLTCAISGYDGGPLRDLPWLDHLLVTPSEYVPRIQEVQATTYHLLLAAAASPQ